MVLPTEIIEKLKFIDEDCSDFKNNTFILKGKVTYDEMYSDKIKKLYTIFKEYEKTGFDEIDVEDVKNALMNPIFVNTLTNGFSPTAPSMLMERVIKCDKPLTFNEFSEIILKSRRISYDIAQYMKVEDLIVNENLLKKYYHYDDKLYLEKISDKEIITSCTFLFVYTIIMMLCYDIDKYTRYKYISYYGELQYYNFNPTMFLTYIFIHKSRTVLLFNIFHFSCVFMTLQYYYKIEIKYIIIIIASSVTYGGVIHLFEETNLSGSTNCVIALISLLFVNIIFGEKKSETSIASIILCIIFLLPIILQPSASFVGGFIGGSCSSILVILKKKLIFIPCSLNASYV